MSNNNPYKGIRIEYHILQSFPVTCLNRDDVGAPKSVIVGGVNRARVSSQCWKRQVRLTLHDLGVKIAIRTKKLEQLFHEACIERGATEEQAKECASFIATTLAKDTLYFIATKEVSTLADYVQSKDFMIKKEEKKDKGEDKKKKAGSSADKELIEIAKKAFKPTALDGLDIALFGRMVANAPELNVEAASRFAHAISTHKVSNEVDYFTAVDDLEYDSNGAGHLGSIEYNSATYYRYISLDLGQLYSLITTPDMSTESLADMKNAVEVFTKALYLAIPSARQSTQTGLCPWEYAKVYIRKGQGIQASFEKPVNPREGYLEPSKEALNAWLERQEKLSGSLFGSIASFTFGESLDYSIDDLVVEILAKIPDETKD